METERDAILAYIREARKILAAIPADDVLSARGERLRDEILSKLDVFSYFIDAE